MKPPATYEGEQQQVQQVTQEQGERNVAMAVCVQLAGRAIIRVVSRCEEAQDNCQLGECFFYLADRATCRCVNIFETYMGTRVR